MSWMCNNRVKIQILEKKKKRKKKVKNLKSMVQNLYCNSYHLHCKETHFIHLQGYVLVSPMVVFITMGECGLS